MQESVRINDLNILFICPSEQWGTLERRVINDCHYLRDIGGNPVLYCIKGSPIDKEAQKFSLPRQFYKGKKVNRIFDLTYLLDLKTIFKENSFDIIHCFNIDYLWTVCFLLKTKPQIPLILTFNRYLKKKADGLFKRWLLGRVDLVMTFSGAIRSVVMNHLPINGKKVHVVGAGVEVLEQDKSILRKNNFVIGTFISHKEELDNLRTFLYAINPILNRLSASGSKARFMVFTDQVNEDVFEASEYDQVINELKLKDKIDFVEAQGVQQALKKMDLFISLAFDEPFNDLEVMAGLLKKPVVAPRTAARRQLFNKFPDIGQTYYFQDARELKDKVLAILWDGQKYEQGLDQNFQRLNSIYGLDYYVEKVYHQYSKLYRQRLRRAEFRFKSN